MLRIFLALQLLAAVTVIAGASELHLLAGNWRVTEIKGRATNATVPTTFNFMENGRAAGSAGCNRYRAQMTLKDDELSFGIVASTEMMCAPAQMAQETAFLAQLPAIRGWRIENGKLLLLDAQNNVVLRAER
ncbi:MAG: META domain-containing protein [Xanthobacteraceae bacterium]|nr:META domain-containing protein [Xanthobacteraceae bacterium]MBX3550588.1 META domain-containing protein [Xanthobacteraceae bacterium]